MVDTHPASHVNMHEASFYHFLGSINNSCQETGKRLLRACWHAPCVDVILQPDWCWVYTQSCIHTATNHQTFVMAEKIKLVIVGWRVLPLTLITAAFCLLLARQPPPLEYLTSKFQDKSVREHQELGCSLKGGEAGAMIEPCQLGLSPRVPEKSKQDRL